MAQGVLATAARRPLIAGNWKMNMRRSEGLALAHAVADHVCRAGRFPAELAIFPPFTLLADILREVGGSGVAIGGQDCHPAESGAHTGDVSAEMLHDIGCTHVIVGHSERRADHSETDGEVCAKAQAAHRAGLVAVICLGETQAQRDDGRTLEVIRTQLAGSLPGGADAANTVLAYEPVWAIGTGRTPTAAEVQQVHKAIRDALADRTSPETGAAMRILYGGSVKPANASDLLCLADVDGALVGGASLDAESFWAIAEACPWRDAA